MGLDARAVNTWYSLPMPSLRQLLSLRLAAGEVRPWAEAAVRGLDMSESARLARAAEQGFEGPWYHGTERLDRLVEGGRIDPRRATSGPMPYFTDDPIVASNYAAGKPDTSRMLTDDGDVANYFTVAAKDIWPGSRVRTPLSVEQSWNYLPQEVKARILAQAPRVGYARNAAGDFERGSDLMLHGEGVHGGLSSPDHYEWVLKNEAKGNPLRALRIIWHDGGELVGNESELRRIFRLAGYPLRISEASAPWTEAKGVLPAMLRMRNPLNTSDVDAVRRVANALRQDFARNRSRRGPYSMTDMWDKNHRYTPKEWVEQLAADIDKGDNSFVWTSIPDRVTERLRAMGYDGVIDTGGKSGGVGHRVAIPFEPNSVRSRFAAFDPNARDQSGLLAGAAVAIPAGGLTLREILRDRAGT